MSYPPDDTDTRRDRVLVVIPTYNEAENLPGVIRRLRTAAPDVDVLVVDDASPDGTGESADAMASVDPAIHVLHRAEKQGLGVAYVAGFRWALDQGYDAVMEMDADGSHQPEQVPDLIKALGEGPRTPDLVLGSRWVPGGRVEQWPWHRMLLSRAGNLYTRLATGLPLADATGGFRAYSAQALTAMDLSAVASQGYCFQVDMALRIHQAGGVIREIPIRFVERTEGHSKMSRRIIIEALLRVTEWGIRRRADQVSRARARVGNAMRRRSRS